MVNDFPRTLSHLRQNRKLSQRSVAKELQVSQALLSHYENGVREPGLSFVVRAADFYGVSADYLLGRTLAQDGAAISAEEIPDISAQNDNTLKGSAAAMYKKKLLINALALFFDVLGKTGSHALITEVSSYLSGSFYKAFRFVYTLDKASSSQAFAAPEPSYSELCDAQLKLSEARLRQMSQGSKKETVPLPDMSMEGLKGDYPQLAPSLLKVLHDVEKQINPGD